MIQKRTEGESKAFWEGVQMVLKLCEKHGLESTKIMIEIANPPEEWYDESANVPRISD